MFLSSFFNVVTLKKLKMVLCQITAVTNKFSTIFWSLNMDLIKAAFVIRRLVIFGFDYSRSKIRRMYIGVAGYKKRFS